MRAIVRGIDRRSTFVLPSWRAWTIVTLAHWLPGLFDAVMIRLGPSSYKDALADAKAAAAREAAGTRSVPASRAAGSTRHIRIGGPQCAGPFRSRLHVESGPIGSLSERRKCVPFPLAFKSAMKASASALQV